MCGVFGVFATEGRLPAQGAVERALATLAHRGPDARRVCYMGDRGVALGHARLAIIDPAARSDQPMARARCTLVFNGEIYNYRTLRAELVRAGQAFVTEGDAEVILAGYRVWGLAVFERLLGMWALALHDAESDALHLCRDPFGIKPLCVLGRSGRVLFASEVKAIAALESLSIDGDVLIDMLGWGFPNEHRSMYAEVEHLPPGCVRTYTRAGTALKLREHALWTPRLAYGTADAECTDEALCATLTQAVDDHFLADVPVAVALSGGLDSSIIAALAARRHPQLTTYTFTLAGAGDVEVEHAAALCRALGFEHRVVEVGMPEVGAWLRAVAWHLEEPIVNINALPGYALAGALRRAGYKVVLVGEGADELFAGYPWYAAALEPALAADPGALFDAYARRRRQATPAHALTPAQSQRLRQRHAGERARFVAAMTATGGPRLDAFLACDQSYQLQYSQLLRVDRMFMAHGVEARVPYLYRPVLEQSAHLPPERKMTTPGATGARSEKIALASACAHLLPPRIAQRPKFGVQGTRNLWDSPLVRGLDAEFRRCLESTELRGARQLLDEFLDWTRIATLTLSAKERFALALLIEAVDALLIARRPIDEAVPALLRGA